MERGQFIGKTDGNHLRSSGYLLIIKQRQSIFPVESDAFTMLCSECGAHVYLHMPTFQHNSQHVRGMASKLDH